MHGCCQHEKVGMSSRGVFASNLAVAFNCPALSDMITSCVLSKGVKMWHTRVKISRYLGIRFFYAPTFFKRWIKNLGSRSRFVALSMKIESVLRA